MGICAMTLCICRASLSDVVLHMEPSSYLNMKM